MAYLYILLTLLLVTFLIHKGFSIIIYQNTRQMIAVNLIALFTGTLWDSYAIANKHWIFPAEKVIGHIGVMPIEEYLFILLITYFILVIYHLVMKKM